MYAISPDGQEVAYTSNIDEVEATSTNDEVFVVPINVGHASGLSPSDTQARGSRYSKKISTSPGADTTPLYSPDGKYSRGAHKREPDSKPINGGFLCKIDNQGKRAI